MIAAEDWTRDCRNLFPKEIIIDHPKMSRGNVTRAARRLGATKRILAYKIKQMGIDFPIYRR